eukprot:scaffold12640_cov106-Isochrysis_galbana.AAC.6
MGRRRGGWIGGRRVRWKLARRAGIKRQTVCVKVVCVPQARAASTHESPCGSEQGGAGRVGKLRSAPFPTPSQRPGPDQACWCSANVPLWPSPVAQPRTWITCGEKAVSSSSFSPQHRATGDTFPPSAHGRCRARPTQTRVGSQRTPPAPPDLARSRGLVGRPQQAGPCRGGAPSAGRWVRRRPGHAGPRRGAGCTGALLQPLVPRQAAGGCARLAGCAVGRSCQHRWPPLDSADGRDGLDRGQRLHHQRRAAVLRAPRDGRAAPGVGGRRHVGGSRDRRQAGRVPNIDVTVAAAGGDEQLRPDQPVLEGVRRAKVRLPRVQRPPVGPVIEHLNATCLQSHRKAIGEVRQAAAIRRRGGGASCARGGAAADGRGPLHVAHLAGRGEGQLRCRPCIEIPQPH